MCNKKLNENNLEPKFVSNLEQIRLSCGDWALVEQNQADQENPTTVTIHCSVSKTWSNLIRVCKQRGGRSWNKAKNGGLRKKFFKKSNFLTQPIKRNFLNSLFEIFLTFYFHFETCFAERCWTELKYVHQQTCALLLYLFSTNMNPDSHPKIHISITQITITSNHCIDNVLITMSWYCLGWAWIYWGEILFESCEAVCVVEHGDGQDAVADTVGKHSLGQRWCSWIVNVDCSNRKAI